MQIFITDKNEVREITLRVWDNKRNDGWSPDCFGDLADTLLRDYPADGYDTDAAAAMTEQEFRENVEWWENEIARYNNREPNSWFVENLDSDEIAAEYAKDLEYSLTVE